jgi:hypothetical protein
MISKIVSIYELIHSSRIAVLNAKVAVASSASDTAVQTTCY